MANNRPDPNLPPSKPRWVKIFVIGFIVLVVVFVILHLMGFGMGGAWDGYPLLTHQTEAKLVMTLTPLLRKLVVTAHVTFEVGWLGAVAGFLALAIAGLNSQDTEIMNSAYLGMDLVARYVILPLSFAPLITGPILSLGTPWGLLRHYWIIAKLFITLLSTIILLIHMRPISHLAHLAVDGTMSSVDPGLLIKMVAASGAALVALIAVTALGVYKPRGMTAYGWRKQYEERS